MLRVAPASPVRGDVGRGAFGKLIARAASIRSSMRPTRRASIGSMPPRRAFLQRRAASRASARLTVCTGPKPITRSRPSFLNRKIQLLAPRSLTCRKRPPPSPKSPRRCRWRTDRVVSFPITRALVRGSGSSVEPILPIPVPILISRTVTDYSGWYKTTFLINLLGRVDFWDPPQSAAILIRRTSPPPPKHHYPNDIS